MPEHTQYLNVTPSNSGDLTWCLHGQCYYCLDPGGPIENLHYGHRVTITLESSSEFPTRLGAYSSTSGEFAIDITSPTLGASGTFDFPLDDEWIELEFQGPTDFDFNVKIDYDFAPGESGANYCAYGTRLKPVQMVLATVSAAAVEIALGVAGFAWLRIPFTALVGVAFHADLICQGPPPTTPSWTADDFIPGTSIPKPGAAGKVWQAFTAAIWPEYCECLPAGPGQPAPTPFPPAPAPVKPDDLPEGPGGIICTPGDPCGAINTLIQITNQLAIQTSIYNSQNFAISVENETDIQAGITVLQTEHVPRTFAVGTIHSGLTGAGELSVSGILGVAVTVTGDTTKLGVSPSEPLAYWTESHIAFGDLIGWLERKPIRHLDQVFESPGWITRVGYHAAAGLTLAITELMPSVDEP